MRIQRGPLTWQSKPYNVDSHDTEIHLTDEEFKKSTGFYFTKNGAELKMAKIEILKQSSQDVNGQDLTLLTSTEINMSSLISMELTE